MFYRTFYRPPIRIKPCFIAIKQWRLEADRRPRFCDGCEETVATDRSLASASSTVAQMDHHLIGSRANNPDDDQQPCDEDLELNLCENMDRSKSA